MLDEPLDVLAVDDVDVRVHLESAQTLLAGARADRHAQRLEVRPLLRLLRPHAVGDAQGRDNEHLVDGERLDEVQSGGERGDAFPKSHRDPKSATLPFLYKLYTSLLVLVHLQARQHLFFRSNM